MLSKLLEYHGKDVRLSHNITRDENFKLFDTFETVTPDNMPLLRMESPSQEPWQMCSQKAFIWAITWR